MTEQEKIKEIIKDIFSEDMLLCFSTHESCPPNKDIFDCLEQSGWDKEKMTYEEAKENIKHPRCMDCWKEWVDGLVDQVIKRLHSQGVVIRVDRELPDILDWGGFNSVAAAYAISQDELKARHKQALLKAGYVAVEPLIEE